MRHFYAKVCVGVFLLGQITSRHPEPLTVTIARYLVNWVGGNNIQSSRGTMQTPPVFLVSYLLNLFARGYPLLWRSALFDYSSSIAMFEWKLWRTDASILSAAADIVLDQTKHRVPLTTSAGSALSGLSRPAIRPISTSTNPPFPLLSTPTPSPPIELIHFLIFRIFAVSQIPSYSQEATNVLLEIGRIDPLRLIRALGYAAK